MLEALIVLVLMAAAGAVSVVTLWKALWPHASRAETAAGPAATWTPARIGTEQEDTGDHRMPASGIEGVGTVGARSSAAWPQPEGADQAAPRQDTARSNTPPQPQPQTNTRVRVHVRNSVRETTLACSEPITPQRLKLQLFAAETADGRSVRFIRGGKVCAEDEELQATSGELVVHAVVGASAGDAPPAAPPVPPSASAPLPPAGSVLIRLGKLFDERPGTVLFVLFSAFLASMWACLLSSPDLMELPARVLLAALTGAAVLLRPR